MVEWPNALIFLRSDSRCPRVKSTNCSLFHLLNAQVFILGSWQASSLNSCSSFKLPVSCKACEVRLFFHVEVQHCQKIPTEMVKEQSYYFNKCSKNSVNLPDQKVYLDSSIGTFSIQINFAPSGVVGLIVTCFKKWFGIF